MNTKIDTSSLTPYPALKQIFEERPDIKDLLDRHLSDAAAFYDVLYALLCKKYEENGRGSYSRECIMRDAHIAASVVIPRGVHVPFKH